MRVSGIEQSSTECSKQSHILSSSSQSPKYNGKMEKSKLILILTIVIVILFLVLMILFYLFLHFDQPVTTTYKPF